MKNNSGSQRPTTMLPLSPGKHIPSVSHPWFLTWDTRMDQDMTLPLLSVTEWIWLGNTSVCGSMSPNREIPLYIFFPPMALLRSWTSIFPWIHHLKTSFCPFWREQSSPFMSHMVVVLNSWWTIWKEPNFCGLVKIVWRKTSRLTVTIKRFAWIAVYNNRLGKGWILTIGKAPLNGFGFFFFLANSFFHHFVL